ncbi:type II secretion system protein GspG [Deltaproteobacteria bacterium]|nr:type II secretion system protein GspG [Deltaproteobacteria bacterium]
MVVIAIMGIIMTVIAVNVMGFLSRAKWDATKVQMNNIETILVAYAARTGHFPTTNEGLAAAAKWFPDGVVPNDTWGRPFRYTAPGTHGAHDFELVSLGADGVEGGDDANADLLSWKKGQEE